MSRCSWLPCLAALCVGASSAHAGLVFELDGKIDVRGVSAAELGRDHVTIRSAGQLHTIQLPDGAGGWLLAWAQRDTGGPLVFSIDGSLVPQEGNEYAPPSVPRVLQQLLFAYDNYAHELACGGTRRGQLAAHPLVQAAGEAQLPHRRYETLLDPATRTPQAYAYRKLAERFVDPPMCVGELSLYAVPGRHGELVSVQPRSWIHMITRQWYRPTDVPSEADKWIARLPYQPLKDDLESRWSAYRQAFPEIDALSSVVEAMAVLRAIKHDAPAVWTALVQAPPAFSSQVPVQPELLESHGVARAPWQRVARAWLGDQIETPVEANLALGLAIERQDGTQLARLDAVAARDPLTRAKLDLASLYFARDVSDLEVRSRRVLATLAHLPGAFRLRAMAIATLEPLADQIGLDEHEKSALEQDFLQRAEAACASGTSDLVTWEGLSQDVYSVGLLAQLRGDDGQLPARDAAAIACIHFHRGMAAQEGRQLAYRHGHYRFLKYLTKYTDDTRTTNVILKYEQTLANAMNLRADLAPQVQR